MSKIIFLAIPAHGHVNPTLPVVQELVRRGEQVLYYNTEEFRPQIERTGATFRAYPETEMTSAAISKTWQNGNIVNFSVMVLRTTEKILTFLLDDLPPEKPDLIIFDSLALWGKMAATLLNVRAGGSISHFVLDLPLSSVSPRELLTMLRQGLPKVPSLVLARWRLIRRFGKEVFPSSQPLFPMRGNLNIVFTSRELQPDMALIDETFRFVGPSINPETRDESVPFEIANDGPVVYMSLGTIHYAPADFYRDCFHTFANYPAQFILSVGKQTDIGMLGTIPPNFIVRPSVPQLEVLQQSDVFITHGGMNSIHEGLYYGVPLIVIPHHFEQLTNARCVSRLGAAVIVESQVREGQFTAAQLREILDRILREPGYRTAAQNVQKTLHATGGYHQAADEIQAYLAEGAGT